MLDRIERIRRVFLANFDIAITSWLNICDAPVLDELQALGTSHWSEFVRIPAWTATFP